MKIVNPLRFFISVLIIIALLVFVFGGGLASLLKSEIQKRADALPDSEQLIGNEKTGTMAVPIEWKTVRNTSADSSASALQYTDPDETLVVTLNVSSASDGKYNADNVKASALRVSESLSESGAVGVARAKSSLSETEAVQVYGYFGETDDVRVIWLLADGEGILHWISADGPMDAVQTAVNMVEETFKM